MINLFQFHCCLELVALYIISYPMFVAVSCCSLWPCCLIGQLCSFTNIGTMRYVFFLALGYFTASVLTELSMAFYVITMLFFGHLGYFALMCRLYCLMFYSLFFTRQIENLFCLMIKAMNKSWLYIESSIWAWIYLA